MTTDDTLVTLVSSQKKHASFTTSRPQSQPDTDTRVSSDFARSYAANWSPPMCITPEAEAHHRLEAEWKRKSPTAKLLVADIHNFEVYCSRDNKHRAYELMCLHFHGALHNKKLCFDGFVRLGNVQCYMQDIPIEHIRVEGYDNTANITVYIQSELAAKGAIYKIWYRLNKPTPRYHRFHDAFLWVGQLGKYVIDYMSKASRSLICFRSDFCSSLKARFSSHRDFERWHAAFNKKTDFRVAIAAYIDYLFTQACCQPNSKELVNQSLWTECMAKGIPQIQSRSTGPELTLATPAVYSCFRDTYFGEMIRGIFPSKAVQVKQDRRKKKLGFTEMPALVTYAELSKNCQPYGTSPVMIGDVVAIVPDGTDSRVWKHTNRDWLAYVQGTETLDVHVQKLFVLWLYWPHDTNIAKAFYPFQNELFLSDNCNCTERELLSTDIKGKCSVDWCPTVVNPKRFFVRQTYTTQESSFETIADEHKTCECRKKTCRSTDISGYRSGDTVYVKSSHEENLLEPAVIQQINEEKGSIRMRRLLRLGRDCSQLAKKAHRSRIAPNELVLTDDYYEVKISQVQRHCFIRFVSKSDIKNDRVPFPYNREGAGDLWFISMCLTLKDEVEQLVFLQQLPPKIRQRTKFEFDPELRGLSLFGGGGELDRGLEEGGAVEFCTVVDSNVYAIRTQQANVKQPQRVCCYCGSVNTFFESAVKSDGNCVIQVGDVDFIAAGCPCVAFSTLQKYFKSTKSLANAALITSFCSFVDLYRPLYGVLENVVEITAERTEYVLCQVVASLVSMGYQVNQYIMDSWSYGSPQHRSRLILTIAAPGLHPIIQPSHTHSLPNEHVSARSLGRLPNGLLYGERESYPTPFRHVPAATVGSGLPDIGNSIVQTCIPYPDHRVARLPTAIERARLEYIPKEPPGCGYKEAKERGLVPLHLRIDKDTIGKSYRRIKKDGLVPTITTEVRISNEYGSAAVHWTEPRPISLQEARRAQGIGDDEPIIGPIKEQYRIVGNGVDRKVSFALGLALLFAQEKNKSKFASTVTLENPHAIFKHTSEDKVVYIQSDDSNSDTLVFARSQVTRKRHLLAIMPDRSCHSERTKQSCAQPEEERSHRSKRLKKEEKVIETSDTDDDWKDATTFLASGSKSTQNSVSSTKTRFTRHSGLAVEFVPKNWNKRVETEYKNFKS